MRYLLPLCGLALQACTVAADNDSTFPEAMASPIGERTQAPAARVEADPRKRGVISAPDGTIFAFAPYPSRDLEDLVPGCPNMNPLQRPRGSNCHGIFPEQCGADLAKAHVGKVASEEVREAISRNAPTGDVRFIRPGDAVIEDLRLGRLNVTLDKSGRIQEADCY